MYIKRFLMSIIVKFIVCSVSPDFAYTPTPLQSFCPDLTPYPILLAVNMPILPLVPVTPCSSKKKNLNQCNEKPIYSLHILFSLNKGLRIFTRETLYAC